MSQMISSGRRNQPPEEPLREIEVLIISAENLKNVKHVTKMKRTPLSTWRKTSTGDDPRGRTRRHRSDMEPDGQSQIPGKAAERRVTAAVNVDIFAHSHLREKLVGSARVLLCDVLKGGRPDDPVDNPIQCMTVQVWRPSGRPQRLLNLWVPPTGKFLLRTDSLSFSV